MQALLLTASYVVGVFSVAIPGTPVGPAARRLFRPRRNPAPSPKRAAAGQS